jgi:predicted nucleic acid-binding protein
MIVVSDTTLFSNLIQIQQLDLLKDLFGEVYAPQKVFEEFSNLN